VLHEQQRSIGNAGKSGSEATGCAFMPEPSARFPMLQPYIDLVLLGALYTAPISRGGHRDDSGLEHLLARRWRDARRPWIHTRDYQDIDKLLKHTAPVSEHFNDPLFPRVLRHAPDGTAMSH